MLVLISRYLELHTSRVVSPPMSAFTYSRAMVSAGEGKGHPLNAPPGSGHVTNEFKSASLTTMRTFGDIRDPRRI